MRVTIERLTLTLSALVAAATLFRPANDVAHAAPSYAAEGSNARRDRVATATVASDSNVPDWLFPIPPRPAPGAVPTVYDSVMPVRLPRVRVAFKESQLHNLFFAPDWDPSAHPTMPAVVARGRQPVLFACAYCHMPDGAGRPENVPLAGLPAAYIVQQVADMKSHARSTAWKGVPWAPFANMLKAAEGATDDEVREAAEYFSSLKPRQRTRVVERKSIPRVEPVLGIHAMARGGGTEVLGNRLIEAPLDIARHDHRDPYLGYVAYVPVGSIARGQMLSLKPMNDLQQVCGSCHGPALQGVGAIPPLAGVSPGYIVRQLVGFKSGARATPASAPMIAIASAMSLDDMIAVASYAATLKR